MDSEWLAQMREIEQFLSPQDRHWLHLRLWLESAREAWNHDDEIHAARGHSDAGRNAENERPTPGSSVPAA